MSTFHPIEKKELSSIHTAPSGIKKVQKQTLKLLPQHGNDKCVTDVFGSVDQVMHEFSGNSNALMERTSFHTICRQTQQKT